MPQTRRSYFDVDEDNLPGQGKGILNVTYKVMDQGLGLIHCVCRHAIHRNIDIPFIICTSPYAQFL